MNPFNSAKLFHFNETVIYPLAFVYFVIKIQSTDVSVDSTITNSFIKADIKIAK